MNLMSGRLRKLTLLFAAFLLVPRVFAEPSATAVAVFKTYAHTVEARLSQQHTSPNHFLVLPTDPSALAQLRSGQPLIEQITTPTTLGALLHHWRATAFVPNATVGGFVRLLQDYSAYPRVFAPQNPLLHRPLSHTGNDDPPPPNTPASHHHRRHGHHLRRHLRFARPRHGYSISRSTHVAEIDSAGTPTEHAVSPSE